MEWGLKQRCGHYSLFFMGKFEVGRMRFTRPLRVHDVKLQSRDTIFPQVVSLSCGVLMRISRFFSGRTFSRTIFSARSMGFWRRKRGDSPDLLLFMTGKIP
jgi:hypothetical protein